MSLVGFEPTIPVFEQAKAFHALDRAATVTGLLSQHGPKILVYYPLSINASRIFSLFVSVIRIIVPKSVISYHLFGFLLLCTL
jgi:hypothetical protein